MLETLIREACKAGSQVHVWPEHFGTGFDASVRTAGGAAHYRVTSGDPVAALTKVLQQATAATAADSFEDFL